MQARPALFLIVVAAITSLQSSCVTAAFRTRARWNERASSKSFLDEKALFKSRIGGRELCGSIAVAKFTWASNQPSKECIYSAGGYFSDPDPAADGMSLFLKQLKVMQVAPEGFIVEHFYPVCTNRTCFDKRAPDVIFIHKTDEDGVVDGSFLDDSGETSSWYEYSGPFAYSSAIGSTKTVHSFKKVPKALLKSAREGLKVYDPVDELYAQLKAWHRLEVSLDAHAKP